MFILENLMRWGMGPALGGIALVALAWFGLRMVLARRWPSWWLLAMVVWVVAHLVLYGTGFVKAQRYLLPAYPFLIVLAAGWLDTVPDRVRETGWGPSGTVLSRLRVAMIGLVALGAVVSGVAMASVYQREHTRIEASEWIFANVPSGSVIATEHWDDGLPLLLPGRPTDAYRFAEIPGFDPDTDAKLSRLIGRLQQADYVVLSSDRLVVTIPRQPDRYPMMTGYYDALLSGELGFELVASFTSPPTFLGVELDDRGAEEALTVYDHPHVRIYRKTDAFSAHDAWYLLHDALGDGGVPRRTIDPPVSQMMLSDAERREVAESGTWSDIADGGGMPTVLVVALWYLLIQLAALPAVPILGRLLPSLPDRGYAVAKTVGVLAIGWGAWMLGSLQLLPFGRWPVAVSFVLAVLGCVFATWRRWGTVLQDLRQRWRWIAATETLFLLAFAGMLCMRALNPDLWLPGRSGEKPMELAMFAAILRSEWFPPHDPWFAGGALHYYYLGYLPWAALTRLIGTTPEIAFNLTLPSLFALLVVNVWSAASGLVAAMRRHAGLVDGGWRPILLALPAPVLVVLVGNLDFARRLGRGEWGGAPAPAWSERLGDAGLVLAGIWRSLTESRELPPDAYWAPTRVIPGTVNEFPYFSFLFGDLHAHALAMPIVGTIVVLAVALATGSLRRGDGEGVLAIVGGVPRGLALGALAGFVTGTLLGANPWDYPPAVALMVAGAAIHVLVTTGTSAPWRAVRDLAFFAAVVVAAGRLLHWPFLERYGSLSPEVLPALESTALGDYLAIHGLMLVATGGYLAMSVARSAARLWVAGRWGRGAAFSTVALACGLLIAGMVKGDTTIFLVGASAACLLAAFGRADEPGHLVLVAMAGLGFSLGLAGELVRFSNDVGRMNLVFKLYLHAWQLMGIAAAVSIVAILSVGVRSRRPGVPAIAAGVATRAWLLTLAVLAIGALAYPVLATGPRLGDRMEPLLPTLDGLAYMSHGEFADGPEGGDPVAISTAGDREAIAWLREHVDGTPVILEAQLPAYRWGGRISSTTGLPTVLGWTWHEVQQRPGYGPVVDARARDIATIYTSPQEFDEIEPLLERYGVRLIVVGELERALYPSSGLGKFERAAEEGQLRVVYDSDGVTIFAVTRDGAALVSGDAG